MRSIVKEYDMFKAGEYKKEFSDSELNYLKAIDEIGDPGIISNILRKQDRCRRKANTYWAIMLFTYFLAGILAGALLGIGRVI